jgi:hypothetical protein
VFFLLLLSFEVAGVRGLQIPTFESVSLILTLASKWGCDTQGGEGKDTLVQKNKTNMNGIDRSQVFMVIE